MKIAIKRIMIVLLAILMIAGIYFAYVFSGSSRIEDNIDAKTVNANGANEYMKTGEELTITTWNIGFGAYIKDYSFFMDGGKESIARSKDVLTDTMENIINTLHLYKSDFYALQEVDTDGTRSYHIDESLLITDSFNDMSYSFAQNYHSAYLLYPVTSPHGANRSGILTLSDTKISSSIRKSLTVQSGVKRILDLDRCYNITRTPVDNGKELVLINTHLTAYADDPTVVERQLLQIYETITEEYEAGNYVICAGDFNKDLLCDPSKYNVNIDFDEDMYKPFPVESIPDNITLVAAYDEKEKTASCRKADSAYVEGESIVYTLDGFLISDNVKLMNAKVQDEEFKYSDHNPVTMKFVLEK